MESKADAADKLKALAGSALARTRAPLERVPRCRSGTLQMPLEVIRANVFTASHVGKARERERALELRGAGRVYWLDGPELTQAHADVWMLAVSRLEGCSAGERVSLPLSELNRALARKGGAYNLNALWSLVRGLGRAALESRDEQRRAFGGLLLDAELEGGKLSLWLNRDMLDVMALGMVEIDEPTRHAVGNRPLAQWLQLCLSAVPSVTLDTIRRRIAPTQPPNEVRRRVKAAVSELQAHGLLRLRFEADVVSSNG